MRLLGPPITGLIFLRWPALTMLEALRLCRRSCVLDTIEPGNRVGLTPWHFNFFIYNIARN